MNMISAVPIVKTMCVARSMIAFAYHQTEMYKNEHQFEILRAFFSRVQPHLQAGAHCATAQHAVYLACQCAPSDKYPLPVHVAQ